MTGISRVCHDPDCMQRIYDIGRKAGEEFMLEQCWQSDRQLNGG